MRFCNIYSKLFVVNRFFTIAIRNSHDESIWEEKHFYAECVMPSNLQRWTADPILVDTEDKTFLFYEAFIGDKGHLEVAEIGKDCSVKNARIILQDKCHYSYPFVFNYEGLWYMIPESSAASEVRLYQSREFPYHWELRNVLLRGKMVDTTVFEKDDELYLLTYTLSKKTERVIPHAYKMNLDKDRVGLDEITWTQYDELSVRGAGPVIKREDNLYRPAQISQKYRYGDAVVFYQVFAGNLYHEKKVGELKPENIVIPNYQVDGLHTYSRSQRYEAIDVRCCVVDYLKPIRKIMHKIKSVGRRLK